MTRAIARARSGLPPPPASRGRRGLRDGCTPLPPPPRSVGHAPDTPEAFEGYLRRARHAEPCRLPVCRIADDDARRRRERLGDRARRVPERVPGYYAFTPHARKGYLREGLELTVRYAFDELDLHRLEANVRPENVASVQLIRSLGFEPRSRSPRYLFFDGDWRDHIGYVRLREPSSAGVFGSSWGRSRCETSRRTIAQRLLELRVARDAADVRRSGRELSREMPARDEVAAARDPGRRDGGRVRDVARSRDDGSYWIGGFQIDRRHQRRGHGRSRRWSR